MSITLTRLTECNFLKMVFFWLFLFQFLFSVLANEDAKRLYDDLMINYNKMRRPSKSAHDTLTIHLKLKLSQIIDVHEKNQIMTTSVWLTQQWVDPKLKWDPERYGKVNVLYVPSEMIWVPDIVLYTTADNDYSFVIPTKATLHYTGLVVWEPPAIFRSLCKIDVKWFPFDTQNCILQFGSWSYSEHELDLQHLPENSGDFIELGIDLSDYYPSVEWDILAIPATRHGKSYSGWNEKAFIDVAYEVQLRRKPLFYTVNLVFPCVGISFLTVLIFYLPSDSGEKIQLSICILVSLTFFFLLLVDLIPSNSVVLPLFGKYLLFTLVMVALSVLVTVGALNLHFRKPATHRMPNWIKKWFLNILPKYLNMRRPLGAAEESYRKVSCRRQNRPFLTIGGDPYGMSHLSVHGNTIRPPLKKQAKVTASPRMASREQIEKLYHKPAVLQAFENICFIEELLKKNDREDKIDEDWKYVAMVVDRLFLIIFCFTCLVGTAGILLQAPALYDDREIIDPNSIQMRTIQAFEAT